MKYVLMEWGSIAQRPEYTPEERTAAFQSWFALVGEMQAAGVYVENYGFSPDKDVTTVQLRDDQIVTTDAPVADIPEQLYGYFMLDCKDLDEAIRWAAKIPHARFGSVEVRPLLTYGQDASTKTAANEEDRTKASAD